MKYIYLLFILLTYNSLRAQVIQTGRPTQAYGTAPVQKGLVQLETGTSVDIQGSLLTWNLSQTTLRYGIVKNFDAYTSINVNQTTVSNYSPSYQGLFSVGIRYRLINKKVQLTYWGEAIVPIYPNVVNMTHVLAMGHAVGKKVRFGYSLAHQYDFGKLNQRNYSGSLKGSYVINVELMKHTSCFFGINALWDVASSQVNLLYDAGIIHRIKDNLQVDLFWSHGINYQRGIYGLGISWLIKNKTPNS